MSVESSEKPKSNFLDIACPYCAGANFVKRGLRKKNRETVQLYLCHDCQRTFTPGSVKGKHYPLDVILDAMSLYYLGYSLEEAAKISNRINDANKSIVETQNLASENNNVETPDSDVSKTAGGMISGKTLLNWVEKYKDLCAFARKRRQHR